MQETSTIYTNAPQKGLVTDLHENLISKELWTFARNAQMSSHLGQIQFVQNEPSNYKCVDLPYTPIGFIKLLDNKWAVFTTDNVNSEIGIFDETLCTYTTTINADCLKFNTSNLITGVSKEMFDCSQTIYWTDGVNPRRFLNFDNIPYKFRLAFDACKTKDFTDELECSGLLMERNITVPCITVRISSGGNLKNGTYQVGIAYTINKLRVSEFYGISSPVRIWSHENFGQALDVKIDGLDRTYDEYELILIYTINNVTNYVTVGFFSTSTSSHHISSIRNEFLPTSLLEIVTPRPRYTHADNITANDQFLLYSGMRTTPELDYQLQAMNIQAEYYVLEVPSDYYSKGGIHLGYNRDEVYAFGIQWLNISGEWSPVYHIPGRKNKGDTTNASGSDAFELSHPDPGGRTTVKKWQVQNTAGDMTPPIKPVKVEYGKVIGMGSVAYMESTVLYPNNKKMFGDNACKPQRFIKMPDNCKTHIYGNNGTTINILGVRFKNIEHPKDADGNRVEGLVGYRIVRGNRENDKTVLAKGLTTNVRTYKEDETEVLYNNYPYNSLQPDPYISSKQTFYKRGSETGFSPLTGYKTDQFNFYSPNTLFSHISLGDEMTFLTEENATVTGYFEHANKHPKGKLLTEFDMYFALILGAIDGYLATRGKRTITTYIDPKRTLDDPTGLTGYPRIVTSTGITQSASGIVAADAGLIAGESPVTGFINLNQLTYHRKDDADHTHIAMEQFATDAISQLNGVIKSGNKIEKVAANILKGLASVGIFSFFALETATKTLDSIAEFSPWQDYAMQYNSHGLFTNYMCIASGDRRRKVMHYQYLYDGINTVEGITYNNFKGPNSVFIRASDPVAIPKTVDNTLRTMSQFGVCNQDKRRINSTASAYYTSIKRRVPDQYGQLDGIEYLDTGMCLQRLNTDTTGEGYQSEIVFGGDTFINKFAIRNTHHFFSQYLYNVPDGYILNYRLYRNVGFPRFWIDTTPYDMSEFISASPKRSNLPQNKHNLDCPGAGNLDAITVVKNRYFYLFNSGVIEFFVESDINVDFRDWEGDKPTFYSHNDETLSTLFRSGEEIEKREEFIYDTSYSKQLVENSLIQQRLDYDPDIDSTCFQYIKNRVIYSQPAFKDQKGDNWRINLVNNFYDFPMAEFGKLTAMHPVDNQQIIFLFDKASPYITVGRDELQTTSGVEITIGDAGLFAREPKPIVFTDFYYGNCQSKHAFVNTQFGSYYPSQRQGRVFNFTGKIDEISRNGMQFWFQNYLPDILTQQFPEFKDVDNAVAGTGIVSVFDNTQERYYLTKRDYSLKEEFKDQIVYDKELNKFKLGLETVSLKDTRYFDDASWTISYGPKEKAFISWHDWHPDWMLQTEINFMTAKDNAIWKHNDSCSSFCNFYGVQYPFALEFLINNAQSNEILRSIEYQLEVGKYYNECRDYNMMLDANFTDIVIHNSEQISGNLKPILAEKNKMSMIFNYPKIDVIKQTIDVIYNKEEQKTRLNMFWDIVKDRGEFTGKQYPLWVTEPNGYIKVINQDAVDYEKRDSERKKFRNTWHKVLLSNLDDGSRKFIFKWSNAKLLNSFR